MNDMLHCLIGRVTSIEVHFDQSSLSSGMEMCCKCCGVYVFRCYCALSQQIRYIYYFHIFKVETFHPSGGREVVKLLIGNKIDLENRAVSRNEGEEWARSKV